ncbi:hypothetical protein BP6252_11626 [Coleophoma cylindrospora]|uniref:Uncharacterized protein n=1 Tax=Coleophoma cylindrospora TaxID=1849047 RepID=A0A3D8QK48_9HELO|nr:hypothetical protein BP6252_11626 [Coleophoma cylindrospora]
MPKRIFEEVKPDNGYLTQLLTFTGPSVETLWRILETVISDLVLNIVYCILDGLGECSEALLKVLRSISKDPDADTEVNNDIHQFIEVKANGLFDYREYPKPIRVFAKAEPQKGAWGVFLWISLVTEVLQKSRATDAEQVLEQCPSYTFDGPT